MAFLVVAIGEVAFDKVASVKVTFEVMPFRGSDVRGSVTFRVTAFGVVGWSHACLTTPYPQYFNHI